MTDGLKIDQTFAMPKHDDNIDRKRHWPRFQSGIKYICVVVGDEPRIAAIINESYGGISLMMEMHDTQGMQPGDEIIVILYGIPTWGSVQWIEEDQDTEQHRLNVQLSKKDAYVT